MEKKGLPENCRSHCFKPGQSGNPSGRPKGTGKNQRALAKKAREAEIVKLAGHSRGLLNLNSVAITNEIIAIALLPLEEEHKEMKDGTVVITRYPSGPKMKALLALFDRIIPPLKVKELDDDGVRHPRDMSDDELMDVMQRMVNLAKEHTAGEQP